MSWIARCFATLAAVCTTLPLVAADAARLQEKSAIDRGGLS